ncbi:MAG: hypothetical protein PVI20_18225 [Desulfobacteraceae bacterium]|jgi:hypothetical protein
MVGELKKTYFTLLLPAVLGIAFIYLAKTLELFSSPKTDILKFVSPLIFVASVGFAVALPIFFRALFAHKHRNEKGVSQADLIKFERNLLYIALVTPYLILPAYILEIPSFYFGGTMLMALYAGYYYYPSERRVQFEKRVFRVQ